MRRCIKYCITPVIAAVILLVAFASVSTAAVDAVVEKSWNTWPSTIYYLALLQGPDSPYDDVTVYITAVDEYTLYINGKEIGSDNDWSTVESYQVNISGPNVIVGVAVKNNGLGNGNGLLVDIKANSDWLGTTTMKRRSHIVNEQRLLYGCAWYYYAGDVVAKIGDKWYDPKVDFFQEITKYGFKYAMLGTMGDLKYNPDNHIEIVTGYPQNIDIGTADNFKIVEDGAASIISRAEAVDRGIATDGLTKVGGIRLRRVEGENLALGKPAQEEKLSDGDLANGYAFNQDPVNITKYVDLEVIRRVNKMVLYTGGTNPDTWNRDSVRGYSVEISLDEFRYEEVGVLHEIGISNADEGGYDWYAIKFPEEWARYLRFKITEPRIFYPNIGEMMVYGVGYVYSGVYESDWFTFDNPSSLKNYDMITWFGKTPEGTKIVLQTKTKFELPDGTPVESDWSPEHTTSPFKFDSPEPAYAFKYRVSLSTQDIDVTPEFQEIMVTYSDTNQPVSRAQAYVLPNSVPMGEMTDFEYTIQYNLNPGQNIKTVAIFVPGESFVDSVYSSDADALVSIDETLTKSTPDTLYVTFATPVTNKVADAAGTMDELKIYFKTELLTNIHEFNSYVFNEFNNDGAGGVKVWQRADKSWTVSTSTILDSVLGKVAAVPKVFTPDPKDNINDFTVIEFELAKVESDVKIKIFDTKGRLVTTKDCGVLMAKKYYLDEKLNNAALAEKLPGYWDGTDDDGDLVPPGVYLYQVVVDTDSGEKIKGGTVVVAY